MTKKKLGIVALVATIALSLSGCIKVVSNLVVHDNDTVSGEYIFAIEKSYAEGMSMDDIMSQLGGGDATTGMVNAKSENYDDGTFVGTKVTFTDEPIGAVTQDGTITRVGDTFVFDAPAPDLTSMEGMPDADKAIASLSITFPGAVTEKNGTLNGTTVSWNMLTETQAPHAVGGATGSGDDAGIPGSVAAGGSGGVPVWLFIVLGVVVVGVIVFFVAKSRGKSKDATGEAEDSTAKDAPAEPKK